jgi:hypothetical protein
MIKVERRFLTERYLDHSPGQWHGPHKLTWVRAAWGWVLFAIEPVPE